MSQRARPVETETTTISFRIFVTWPDADVDAVYPEAGAVFSDHTVKPSRTPTRASVENFIDAVHDDVELIGHDVRMVEPGSLMMGCCSMVFEIDADRIYELDELIRITEAAVKRCRRQHVRYHRPGKYLPSSSVLVMNRG